jgi:hypothetical protein
MADKPDYVNGEPKPIPNDGPSMHDLVSDDLQTRKSYGLAKYDSLLQAFNGRNFLQDIYEEMQDGIVYLRGALEEQELTARYIKFLLERLAILNDAAYPYMEEKIILRTQGTIPGWLYQVTKEALGDRYEHSS